MPFYDLCNRLDVTSTHKSSDSRAWCLRTFDLRFTRRPVTRALARAGHDEIHIDAEFPLLEDPTPGGAAVWAPQRPATTSTALSKEAARERIANDDPHAHIQLRASRTTEPVDVSCRNALTRASTRRERHRRTLPLAVRQHHADMSPKRLPSMSPQAPADPKVCRIPEAATAPPTSPPERSFQHAFTRTLCALGPAAEGYSPTAHVAT